MKQLLSSLFVAGLSLLLICCSEDGVSTGNYSPVSPYICIADSMGNVLGGDTADWSRAGLCNEIRLCYPNPVYNRFTFELKITIPNDTLSLYAIDNNDTLFLFKNEPFAVGMYHYVFYADSLNLSNKVLNFCMTGKKMCWGIDPKYHYCGDVQFY